MIEFKGGDIKNIFLKERELYQEIDIYSDGVKVGEAEVNLNAKMLTRLGIYAPVQNQGIGQEAVRMLCEKYGIKCLWSEAENARAIHVYEKCGFHKSNETVMFRMEKE